MKKILILSLFLCIFIISGCGNINKQNVNNAKNKPVQKEITNNTKNEPVQKENISDAKICNDKILGLQFSYPNNWGNCWVSYDRAYSDNTIYFRTDFKKYIVDLVGEVREINQDKEKFISRGYNNEKISNNTEIFKYNV